MRILTLTLTLALTRLRIVREHGVLGLFEGLGPRAVQTVLQNFISNPNPNPNPNP